jgi:hypothetical protein
VAVERRGLVRAETPPPGQVRVRQVHVDRLARRIEQVRIHTAHLMAVHDQVRMPRQDDRRPSAGFGLRLREPVAVHVEQVVIAATRRPQSPVRHRLVVRIGHLAGQRLQLAEVALPPVRVHERIDMDDHLVAQGAGRIIRARGEQVCHLHGRVGARELVAVDAVGEPRHARHPGDDPVGLLRVGQPPGIGQLRVVGLDLVDPVVVVGAGDRQVVEGAALVRAGVRGHGDEIGCLDQLAEVADDRLVARGPLADRVPEHRCRRRDGRVHVRRREQRIGLLPRGRQRDRQRTQ